MKHAPPNDNAEYVRQLEECRAQLFYSGIHWVVWRPWIRWPQWLAKRWGRWRPAK